MGTLAFFPWFDVKNPIECGDLVVLPFRRGIDPGVNASEQKATDAVLARYQEANGDPVRRAAVLQHRTQVSPTDPVDEQYHLDLFIFADLLAFAALANRQFFGPFEYSNRDHYRLVVQQFTDPTRGVLVTTRRRDGSTNTFYSGDTFNVQRPHHVHATGTAVDADLLCALVTAKGHADWPQLYQAIVLFNEANTDRLEVPPSTELILAYAAFEQVLGVAGARPKAAAVAFSEAMRPREDLPSGAWAILQGNPRAETLMASAPTLRSAWFLDFGISRGSVAHGHTEDAYPACWSPSEHLLLAAHALPLLVKQRLVDMVGYKIEDADRGGIEVFERLLNERHLEDRTPTDWSKPPWQEVMGRERMRAAVRFIEERILGGEEDDES